MKHFKLTLPIILLVVSSILYLLQACGGVHYNSYVEDYKDIAIREMQRTGYPASIKLAQAILESEGGRNILASGYNNHFGILCKDNWTGEKYYQLEKDFATGESIEACYRVYDRPEESFIAHTNLLKRSPYFQPLFNLNPSDYVGWAERLTELQYTGNETYDITLINMIEKYGLDEFDDIALGQDYSPVAAEQEDRPSTFDYQDDRIKEEYKERASRTSRHIEDRFSDLKENIEEHNAQYPRRRRNWQDELDAQIMNAPRRRPSRNTPYSEYDDPYSSINSERNSSSYDPYSSTNSARNSEQYEDPYGRSTDNQGAPENEMDAKYKDLYSTDNQAPSYSNSRPTYQETRRPTSSSSYQKPRPRYEQRERFEEPEEDWYEASEESTSLDDFKENYSYINRIKMTTARYDDTPLTIAKRFNVSVKDIVTFNESISKNNQFLRAGRTVFLGPKKKNYEGAESEHIVQYKETMKDISDMYGVMLSELYTKNRMPMGSEPALGERIRLKRGKAKRRPELRANYQNEYQSATSPPPPNSVALDNKYESPAKPRTRVTSSQPAIRTNPSVSSGNYPDQEIPLTTVLLQPVKTKGMFHIVERGETLYRIAQQYGTSVDQIRHMNNLNNNTISRGMRLKVK